MLLTGCRRGDELACAVALLVSYHDLSVCGFPSRRVSTKAAHFLIQDAANPVQAGACFGWFILLCLVLQKGRNVDSAGPCRVFWKFTPAPLGERVDRTKQVAFFSRNDGRREITGAEPNPERCSPVDATCAHASRHQSAQQTNKQTSRRLPVSLPHFLRICTRAINR